MRYLKSLILVLIITQSLLLTPATGDQHTTGYIANQDGKIEWDYVFHDSRDQFYRNPGWGTTHTGAVPVGTNVILRIRTASNDLTALQVKVWDNVIRSDIWYNMEVTSNDNSYDYWEVTINSPIVPSDHYYAFKLIDGLDADWYNDDTLYSVFEDSRVYQTGGEGMMRTSHFPDGDYSIIFHDPLFTTPDWHKEGVGYQIFTDRFFNGDTSNDPVGNGVSGDVTWWEWDSNGNGVADAPDTGRVYVDKHESWDELPTGGSDYYGGDLQGVMQKGDYLKDLGIDFIWFNPFSESPDNHGYAVDDYRLLDSYYGIIDGRDNGRVLNDFNKSMEFFKEFDQHLEQLGIKIIYDTVINHHSAQGMYFQRYEHQGITDAVSGYAVPDYYPDILGAYEDPVNSPYKDWFQFSSFNHNYDSWFGFNNIPTISYSGSNALENLVTGPDNIFEFWTKFGVDGFRLDVNHQYVDGEYSSLVNKKIRESVKNANPDAVIIGEIWERASQWLTGTMNDAVQNMPFRFNTIDWLLGNYNDIQYTDLLNAVQENYPREAFYSLWTNLGNHDRTRIRTALGGDVNLVKVASTLQFAYPGVPVIWYGDEAGAQGAGDPGTRVTYPWGSEDISLLDHYKKLTQIRKSYPVMVEGEFEVISEDNEGVIIYHRYLDNVINPDALIIGSRNAMATGISIQLENTDFLPGDNFIDLLDGNKSYEIGTDGKLDLDIPAQGHMILIKSSVESITSSTSTTTSPSSTESDTPLFIRPIFLAVIILTSKKYLQKKN